MDHLPGGDRQPYTTVLGLLQSMEKAGLVRHEKESRTHRYRPTLTEREATNHLLVDFLGRFFRESAERLVLGLVDANQIDPEALKAIEARLAGSTGAVDPKPKPSKRPGRGEGKP